MVVSQAQFPPAQGVIWAQAHGGGEGRHRVAGPVQQERGPAQPAVGLEVSRVSSNGGLEALQGLRGQGLGVGAGQRLRLQPEAPLSQV
jgi:hypothetical protein